jgi:hypothetical protein
MVLPNISPPIGVWCIWKGGNLIQNCGQLIAYERLVTGRACGLALRAHRALGYCTAGSLDLRLFHLRFVPPRSLLHAPLPVAQLG